MLLSNTKYDIMKRFVQVILPAIGSAYFALDAIWGLPAEEQVLGTTAVIATFLGVVLGISSSEYRESGAAYDGQIVVTENPVGPKLISLELDDDPANIEVKDSVAFKVVHGEPAVVEDDVVAPPVEEL